MHTIVETPAYLRAAKEARMSDAEMARIVDLLAREPQVGAIIVGTGGCRKVRMARGHGGKSGGYRVITFFGGDDLPVFLVTVFGKNEKADLSGAERNALARMTASLAAEYRRPKRKTLQ